MMKQKLAAILAGLMLLFPAASALALPLYEPDGDPIIPAPVYSVNEDGSLGASAINAQAAICIDADTGEVLYALQPDQQLYPASITKVMTCILALEYMETSSQGMSEIITVQHTYQMEDGAVEIYMKQGEQFTMEQLLHALMLKSANDVALLLAEHIGGSVTGFADMMNEKAAELGMTNTHFVTPNGLHDDNHYTTARDMATLMQYAITNETFCRLIKTMGYQIPETPQTPEIRYLSNSNRLLKQDDANYYAPCQGGKTGYTSKARNTFVCYAQENGRTVVAAVLNSPLSETRFASGKHLLRYGLENFTSVDLTDQTMTAQISGSKESPEGTLEISVLQRAKNGGQVKVVMRKQEGAQPSASDYTPQVEWKENLSAPIAEGDVLGKVSYYRQGEAEPALICDLVAARDVEAAGEAEPVATAPQSETVPVVTDLGNQPAQGGASLTTWITVAFIVLIALIVVVAIMLLRVSGSNRHRAARRTPPRTISQRDVRRGAYDRRGSSRGRSAARRRGQAYRGRGYDARSRRR